VAGGRHLATSVLTRTQPACVATRNTSRTHGSGVRAGAFILSGNTSLPDKRRRADLWTSRDLRTWTELPARLQSQPSGGTALPVAANQHVAVAVNVVRGNDHYIWRRRLRS